MRLTASVSGAGFCLWLVGAGVSAARAQSQDPHPVSVLVLKDPTPRPPELDKLYAAPDASHSRDAAPARQTAYFQQRQALVTRASHQLTALAETLNRAVGMQADEKGRAQEVQVAGLIEQLAANVRSAMAPPVTGKQQQRGAAPAEVADLTVPLPTQTAELVAVARELQDDVDKTTPDTLPVGILLKASRVMTLAHGVKQKIGGR